MSDSITKVLETDDVLFAADTGFTGAVNSLFAVNRLAEVPHAGLVPHGFEHLDYFVPSF